MKTKTLGRTDLQVSIVGLGGANLGLQYPDGAYRQYVLEPHVSIADQRLGVETVCSALEVGARMVDTAPRYGLGSSETIIGAALRIRIRPDLAERTIVATKIGCVHPHDGFDHSYGMALHSIHQSIERLGRKVFQILYLHDPMGFPMDLVMGPHGTMQVLRDLRRSGTVKYLGVAANDPDTAADYIETGEFDVATVSGAWSLINQKAAERIFPVASRHNVGLVVTTAIERGLLATGPIPGIRYLERNFSAACLARVAEIKQLCEQFRIPLVAAALQWCTRHPQVACVIPGARTPQEARQNTLAGSIEIPEEFWSALQPLVAHFESYKQETPT